MKTSIAPFLRLARICLTAIPVLLLFGVSAADALRFEPLGIGSVVPPAGGQAGSVPNDLSSDGSVVVGYVYTTTDDEFPEQGTSFRWEGGTMQNFVNCTAFDSVSANGNVAAGRCYEDLYFRDGGLISAGVWQNADGGSVNAVSGDGTVLFGTRPVLYRDDFFQTRGFA